MHAAKAQGDLERALHWAQTISGFIVFGGNPGHLALAELEQITAAIAQTLPAVPTKRERTSLKRCLHVFTEAYELFGHTKLCRKWVELDSTLARHDVVLLAQYDDAPLNLRQSVEARGGRMIQLDRTKPLLERARLLRELAYAEADVVILHVHPFDVLPSVAFGVPGGPPVIYVNHADHEFWVGGAVADLVLDIRESGQEWTRMHRGISRTRILPIPLEEDPRFLAGPEKIAPLREQTRAKLGIGKVELMLLTIGSARKYLPMRGLSFLEAAEEILTRCPQAKIVAVGPKPVGEWLAVSERTGGRLIAVGNQSDLGQYHAAADLYLEGMPAGSLTALLETCLAGVPCVRSPSQVRPPNASDGAAFAPVAQPASVAAYVNEAVALVKDDAARRKRAAELQHLVRVTHCAEGWSKLLAEIVPALPQVHAVYREQRPQPIGREETEFKLEYSYQRAAQAAAGLVTTFLQQAVRNCEEARLIGEKSLPEAAGTDGALRGLTLFEAILPELRGKVGAGEVPMEAAPLAKELMEFAAESGRKSAAWRFALRAARSYPGIWQRKEFRKGLVKSLPGMLTVARVWKTRRH